MSSALEIAASEQTVETGVRARRLRQVVAILRLEARKNFFGKRSLLLYLLALSPVLLLGTIVLFALSERDVANLTEEASAIYAAIYGGLILRTVVFFGCAWIFMNLFRGEIVDRSLHYYFLSAVRREVLVAGKYLSGLMASIIFFGGTTLLSYFVLYVPRGLDASLSYIFNGPGLKHALTYLGITALACVGYGAVFLLVGLFFRNPIIPALAAYGWEWINFLLPPLLKKISVVHYLNSLMPVPMMENSPFAVMADPTPAWISVPGLLFMTALALLLAGWRIRHMEISYGSD
ncbi:MAG: hypothetical protein ABR577_01370 [Pyrinomonadaceae bacterium]